ncbi:MAG: delta-1-pyrroline-5-carboxylate dehydrogenase, partial [Bacteroidetes bacterium]|nr:delta-1-pyrroline-5-carboxylate dehydrogenase [Bacteroidota bacterium]
CPLSAETGGKNAIILTASGDRDHAIQNIITSAFSNAGQKCSACSLLLLEKEVYHDPEFKVKLIDAVTSLHTGGIWNGGNVVGPMITNQNEKLLHAIDHLEEGEWWLVKSEFADEKKFILKPCVKWGVKPGSYTFTTELFAPLLAVVCIDNLQHGISLVNSSEYGLTSGLQSLDESEQLLWKNNIEAGNLYINRGITGAIVNRQPFGGMKRSAFGGGIKAGGPNYVSCFINITEKPLEEATTKATHSLAVILHSDDKARFNKAVESYQVNMENIFSQERDCNKLIGEQNIFRYLPLRNMALRIYPEDELCDVLMVLVAANITRTPVTLSITREDPKLEALQKGINKECTIKIQSDDEFLNDLEQYERIRTCSSRLPYELYKQAARLGKYIATAKPLVEGRVELLHYMKEQSIAFEYHRYGSITDAIE